MLCVAPHYLTDLCFYPKYPLSLHTRWGDARWGTGAPPPLSSAGAHVQVLFGTADGQVIVMDCHGRMLAHVLLHESDGILSMSWNYPAFLVEDSSESDTDSDDYSPPQGSPAPRDPRGEGLDPFEAEGKGLPQPQHPDRLG